MGEIGQKDRIYFSPPHMSGKEMKYIEEAFASNWIAPLGHHIDALEKETARILGAGEVIAVNSGTSAIHLALLLLNVKEGDFVFCSSLTFVASANPILYQKATPVFIDSEPDSWCMSPQSLKRALVDSYKNGRLPKAVIVVHLFGQVAKMDEIMAICNEYDVPVIEDAAESFGSTYRGRHAGTFGKFGIISFNGNKIITTSCGGVLICPDKMTAARAKFLAAQAKDPAPHYQHSTIGYNYRMSNVLAGIGRGQLEVLEERVSARRRIFQKYYEELKDLPGFTFMPELKNSRSNRWLTAVIIDEKESGISSRLLLEVLAENLIEARLVWKPLHRQPLYQGALYYPYNRPESVSDHLFQKGLCLPSGSNLTDEQQMRVIECIKNAMKLNKMKSSKSS